MLYYDQIDFLEHFDNERILDEEAGIFEYTVISIEKLKLTLQMNVYEDTVFFTLTSEDDFNIIDFGLENITIVRCDKNHPSIIRFLFYKENEEHPIVTAHIKPRISLYLDIEQKGP
jgi:hypothetical protein